MALKNTMTHIALGSWLVSATSLLTAVLRGKMSAVYLGPAGVGVVGQLNSLSLLGGAIAVLGVGTAAVQLIARQRALDDENGVVALTSFVLRKPLFVSVLLAGLVTVFSRQLAAAVFDRAEYAPYMIVVALSLPLNVMTGCVSIVLQARSEAARTVTTSLISLPINTAVVIIGIVLFGLAGAAAGVLLTSAVPVIVYAYRERGWLWRDLRRATALRPELLREGMHLGVASFALGVASSFMDSATRVVLTHSGSLGDAGRFQVLSMASAQGFLQIINGVMIYLGPRLAGSLVDDEPSARAEIERAWRLTLAVVSLAVWTIIAFAEPLLRLLFSKDFVPAAPALVLQASGEVLRSCAFVVGAIMLPLGLRTLWLSLGLATLAIQFLSIILLAPSIGLMAAPIGFLLGWFVNLSGGLILAQRRSLIPTWSSLGTATAVFALSLTPTLFPSHPAVIIFAGTATCALVAWLLLSAARRKGRTAECLKQPMKDAVD